MGKICYGLNYLNIDSYKQMIFISTKIKMLNGISEIVCKTCVFAKKINHVSENFAIRALISGERIYIDLIKSITPIKYFNF